MRPISSGVLGDVVKMFAYKSFLSSHADAAHSQQRGSARVLDCAAEFVTSDATERCVICRADTGVSIFKNKSLRADYVDGIGQLCRNCSREMST